MACRLCYRRRGGGGKCREESAEAILARTTTIERLRGNLKSLFRKGRGRNMARFIQKDLNPVLRGWSHYFRLAEFLGFAEELDKWLRRLIRCMLWRQWKRPWKRFKMLMKLGLAEERAARHSINGGPGSMQVHHI
jgi:RNA-directed DNA polymerase